MTASTRVGKCRIIPPPPMVGTRIREARTSRNLSLIEVASRADVSVATLSRIERNKQRLDLGLFLILCRVFEALPQELLGDESGENLDPLALQVARLDHGERVQLWKDLANARRGDRTQAMRSNPRRLKNEIEGLLAQMEYVKAEIESVQRRMRKR
jgi:transcriptional regulator with XRE-family HTH domain